MIYLNGVPGIGDGMHPWFLSRNQRARSDRVFFIAVGDLLLNDDGVSSEHTVSLGKEIMGGKVED